MTRPSIGEDGHLSDERSGDADLDASLHQAAAAEGDASPFGPRRLALTVGLILTVVSSAIGVLAGVVADVDEAAGGDLARYTWGADGGTVGRADIRHPLSRAIPLLGRLTDPVDVAVPGDRATVRAQAPGFGASERFAVSPGREAEALFQMPGGQAGNPRTPWYLSGHEDWIRGRPAPFLPGPAKWTLVLKPAG